MAFHADLHIHSRYSCATTIPGSGSQAPLLAQVADVNLRPILPDLLSPGLDLVICGTAAGYRSAEVGAYYAHGSNKFWRILAEIGLTPRRLKPDEYPLLPKFGIGLTDLAKYYRGADSGLADGDLDITGFRNKIESICPHILAFNGKTAARLALGRRSLHSGRQDFRLGNTIVFVLPSTSGRAGGYWDPGPWRECADLVRKLHDQRRA